MKGGKEENLDDLCAAWQRRIVTILIHKTLAAGRELKVKHIALAGGVAANSGLRKAFFEMCDSQNWSAHVPSFEYCTDNAGMIAIAGYYKYLKNEFCGLDVMPFVN